MIQLVRQLCGISVICGLLLSLTPEGGVKKTAALCSTVLLLMTLLTAVRDFDYSSYSLELARYRDLGRSMAQGAEDTRERLNRRAMEAECAAYLQRQAENLEAKDLHFAVTARWDSAGFWLPCKVRVTGRANETQKQALSGIIRADFGIDADGQEWMTDESENNP